ncbi:MAG TPA: hypothetical protein VEJ18_09130 [Planctomycetota bacterium]|nr:hypothetical protein [Planctomycetota bacterium]
MWIASLLVLSALAPQSAAARKAARELVEALGRETLEAGEARIARLVESYGDDAAQAVRRAGAPAVAAMETWGGPGARILSRWGDDGLRLLSSEGDAAVGVLAKHGDGAVEFMLKHPGAGRELIAHFGAPPARAALTTEGVVTLNRLAEPIKASGRAAELMGVVERFGDRACAFLWRNKGVVFGAALLAAFLADPQPYIDGAKTLIVEPAGRAASEAVGRANWTLIFLVLLLAASAWIVWRYGGRPKAESGR